MAEEEKMDLIETVDEEGNPISFLLFDVIEFEGREYALLLPADEDEESDDERAFNKKPVWKRFLIVAAGPFNNFILAAVLCFIVIATVGIDKPIVDSVSEGYSAAEQGIQPGDEIIYLDN